MLPDVDRPDDTPPPHVAGDERAPPTLEEVYDSHAGRVWRTLRALGVPPDRVDDALQDVFLVVHRRLPEFQGRAAITTWLYGIARRIAVRNRRRDAALPLDRSVDAPSPGQSPLEAAERGEAARLVLEVLDQLDDDKREVIVLIELEQLRAPVVAELLGIPLNTVYSRLRMARQAFEAALARRVEPGRNR